MIHQLLVIVKQAVSLLVYMFLLFIVFVSFARILQRVMAEDEEN